MEIIRKNISIYGHATLSAGLGVLIGHYSSSLSLRQGATIGLINGLTCTFISSQWENKTSQLYSMASLAFLILAARTLAPLLKGRVEVPSTSTLLLLAIPSTLFSMIHRSPSPERDKETSQTSDCKKPTTEKMTSHEEETKEKREKFIPDILALFGVDGFSRHLRRFPPVGRTDTRQGFTEQQTKDYRKLIDNLKSSLPQDQDRFLEEMSEDDKELYKSQPRLARDYLLELELAYYLKKIFPETCLHLLSVRGHHGLGLSYKDEKIISVSKVIRKECVLGIEFHFSNRGNPILLQQARRGCTAACTAMLIYQYDSKLFDQAMVNELYSTNLGNTKTMTSTLERYGLTSVVTKSATLEEMQKLLSQNGSAIVSVYDGVGGHVVMLDEITDRGVIVRDPYHGWEITLTREAFEQSSPSEIIQVSS